MNEDAVIEELPDFEAHSPGLGPRPGFWKRIFTSAGREDSRARALEKAVRAALQKPQTPAARVVMAVANEFAKGMVARWLDERATPRCAVCIETGDLKRMGKNRKGKVVWGCKAHAERILNPKKAA